MKIVTMNQEGHDGFWGLFLFVFVVHVLCPLWYPGKHIKAQAAVHYICLNRLIHMKVYKKYYTIPAPPETVYLALTNPLTIQLWTGEVAEMATEPNTEFSLWDGSITGMNLEFEPNRKIVQQWYFGDQKEKSIVTIKLHPAPEGTSAELSHTNIPDAAFGDISEGWNTAYFGALVEFYAD